MTDLVCGSVDLGWALEIAFLVSSQVVWMLLVGHPILKIIAVNQTLQPQYEYLQYSKSLEFLCSGSISHSLLILPMPTTVPGT